MIAIATTYRINLFSANQTRVEDYNLNINSEGEVISKLVATKRGRLFYSTTNAKIFEV